MSACQRLCTRIQVELTCFVSSFLQQYSSVLKPVLHCHFLLFQFKVRHQIYPCSPIMDSSKPQLSPDYQEFEPRDDAGYQKSVRTARLVESVRLGLTTVALLAGISIVGTSGDTLSVYNTTTLADNYNLSLWPNEFDLRPTIALITCGAIVFVASTASIVASKLPPVSILATRYPLLHLLTLATQLRNNPIVQTSTSFLIPTICLIAALIGTSFFYGVNSSNTVFSLQAWSCQWSDINMNTKPHWGSLCKESKAALYLMVMVVPLEVLVLGTAAWGAFAGKKQLIVRERKGSPAMS